VKKLFLKNWRDIKDRKAQFGALIVLVALGVSSYVSFISGFLNLSASAEDAYGRLKFADFSVKVFSAPKTVVSKIESIKGVKAVQGRLIVDTGLYISEEEQAQARIVGVPAGSRPKVNDILIQKGHYLRGRAKDSGVLLRTYADARKVGPGDIIKPLVNGEQKEIRVAGLATNPEYFYAISSKGDIPAPGEFAVIWMAQSEVERVFQKPPSYTDISVTIEKGANRAKIIKEAEDILDPYIILETVKREDQPSAFSLNEEIRQNQSFAYIMPLVVLFIASLSLFIALSRLVQSQRGEIGLAKALGYRNWQIVVHYLVFALFIALAGSVVGYALGYYFAREITRLYVDLLGIPFLKHQIYASPVVGSVLMSSIACILAGITPAYASAKMRPAIAMRADPTITLAKGRTPLVERALAKIMPIPFVLKLPLRNVFRARRRSVYTIVGIAFALILTVSTGAMFDSINYLLDYQFYEVEKWDMVAVFNRNFSHDVINRVESMEGVKRVQPVLMVPAKLIANGKKRETAITAMEPDADFHGFAISEGFNSKDALKMDGLILTPLAAQKLGVKVGDKVGVETPYIEDRRLTFEVLALSEEMIGTPVFANVRQGRKILRAPGYVYNSLYLDVDPREGKDIKKKLYELPGATAVMIKQSLLDKLQELMSFTYVFFGVMLAFAFTMAFVVVYNTFTTNILERTREIATMRTIGEDRWHLAVIVTLENLLLAVAGIPLGLWLGARANEAMYASLSSEAFTLKAIILPFTYVWITGSILVVLLISEVPAIRRIFRLNLAEATKILE